MKRATFLILSIFILAIFSYGQTSADGVLRGQVKDVTGAIVVGASVTVADGNGLTRTTQTDQTGAFSFNALPAGNFAVRAENPGFAVYEAADVRVAPNKTATLEIILNIEVVETQVNVTDQNTVSTAPEANAGAIILQEDDIEALPDDEEDLAAALQEHSPDHRPDRMAAASLLMVFRAADFRRATRSARSASTQILFRRNLTGLATAGSRS